MRRLYTLLLYLALPFASLLVLWRGLRERHYWQDWGQRFGSGRSVTVDSLQPTWVHAVSVGEVAAAMPLVAALQADGSRRPLVLTSTTPAGRDRARATHGDAVDVRFAPYDLPFAIRRFLARTRPRQLVILETELWPNLLDACAVARIPVLIASARISDRTLRSYRRFRGLLTARALANMQVAAQTEVDARRFVDLGVPAQRVTVAGNIKFDRAVEHAQRERGQSLRQRYAPDVPVWVAGSTHPGEELAALDAHRELLRQCGPALLVLAPRHSRRFGDVADALQRQGWKWQRRSAAPVDRPHDGGIEVLLLDTIGELADFYAAADLAFVGGSLVPVGGHNLLEPLALGIATITGPAQFNAPDVARLLRERQAICEVADAAGLVHAVVTLMRDAPARAALVAAGSAALQENRGALQRVLAGLRR